MAVTPKRRSARPERRTFVLDTSVLLADPAAITRFDEHEVVIPLVVVSELEGKRHHPELGYFARSALRMLDLYDFSAEVAKDHRDGRPSYHLAAVDDH